MLFRQSNLLCRRIEFSLGIVLSTAISMERTHFPCVKTDNCLHTFQWPAQHISSFELMTFHEKSYWFFFCSVR